ncbi:hypothetical protein PFRA20S_00801 [Pseudomonas fragi]|nr:hypothetical protein SAMN05216594_2440 [Pseudomonas fragi]
MPGGPLRRTSSRPPDGAGRSTAVEAADRPACLNAGFATDIFPCGSRACPRCRHLVLSGGTKCCHRGQARSHKGLVLFKFFAFAFAFVVTTRLCRRRECPSQKAERRCCYGGGRGRTPRQPRWAMDGPSRRAPITVPERGNRRALASRPYGRAKPIFQLTADAGYVPGVPVKTLKRQQI